MTNWGTGPPRREFLHVDDMAAACLHLLEHYDGPQQVNVGTGRDATIAEIAEMVADAVGFEGETALGHHQAGRHPAEAARRQQARGRRVDAQDRPRARASRRPSSGTASTSVTCAKQAEPESLAEVWVRSSSGWS